MEKLRKVKLLGELGRKFGREFEFFISSPAEAIRALVALLPNFQTHLIESEEAGVAYRVVVNEPGGIGQDELQLGLNDKENVVIISPVIVGRGGGFGRILLGGALLVGSFFMPATIGIFGMTLSSTTVGLLGASLMLGGISQLLTSNPATPKEKEGSYLFDSAAQVGIQGQAIPVGYGTRLITGFPVLSSSVTTVDVR